MRQHHRRKFLQITAAAGVGYWVTGGLSPKRSLAANEEIRFACVGVGGQGRWDTEEAASTGRISAICDVDQLQLGESASRYPQARTDTDWRKMLDEIGDQVDAVTISTPDHSHAPIAVRAMTMGLHCFLQKPLTHTIPEARLLGRVARETKVATQMGNQGTALDSLRQGAALVQSGRLGEIREIHAWTNRPQWPQGIERPNDMPPVPKSLNWDVWIGPAPMRPYHSGYHPFNWRGWWDFGTGALGDMGCHIVNLPFAACHLSCPSSVTAVTSGHNGETYPAWSVITFEFPATNRRAAVTLKWYDGGQLPPAEIIAGAQSSFTNNGCVLVGEKGTLYAPGSDAANLELIGSRKVPEVVYEKSPGHFQEWVDAIRGGKPAMSNFSDYAAPLTETILLGNVAVWAARDAGMAGKKVEWDAAKLEPVNAPEVMPLLKKSYRRGFELKRATQK